MVVSSDFFSRLGAYPMVSSAYQQATSGVAWAKDRSVYARSAAGLAESGLRRVAGSAGPLLDRYEARIAQLDRLACQQLLDRLETACPVVKEPASKVVERSRGYYSAAVKPKVDFVLSPVSAAVAKAQAAKSAGLERYRQMVASRHGQAGLRQFDQLIELLGDCIDKYMPPEEAELHQANGEAKPRKTDGDVDGDDEEDSADEAECTGKTSSNDAEKNEPADPARSLALAFDLGRKVSVRVSHRVADRGQRLVHLVTGRSASATSDSAVAASAASSNPSGQAKTKSEKNKAANGDVDDEDDSNSSLNRSDMSTD